MDKMTVNIDNYEMDVDRDFILAYAELKEYIGCWRSTIESLHDLVIQRGSEDRDADHKHLFNLLRNLTDIRHQLDALMKTRVAMDGKEIKED
jgi:hypothetical protein